MKLMLVGDVHLSDRPPSVRTETYSDDILNKLRFASTQASLHGCEALVLAGDVFHIKAPSRTSHGLVVRAHEALREGGLPVLVVPGNHDMSNDRIDSLPSQPLGSLAQMEGIELLMGWHPSLPLYGLPWLSQGHEDWWEEWGVPGYPSLLVTHASIFPPGEEPPYDFIPAEQWGAAMGSGACYYGHIHDPHGVYQVGNVLFCNNGALSRGSLHEQTLKRKPAITLFDDNGAEWFTRIEVPHLPAAEVFRLAEVAEGKAQQGRLDEFLAEIGSTQLTVTGTEELLAVIEQQNLRPETLQAIREAVEAV